MKRTRGEQIFQVIDIVILLLTVLTIIFPFMHIVSLSLSGKQAVLNLAVGILPKGLNFQAYREILVKRVFLRSLFNTVILTAVYTALSLIVNVMAAYGFSKNFFGKRVITYVFVLSMYFSGGLIPTYILMTQYLHLYNSYLALILPGLVNVFYIIIIRSQIEAIPESLVEAAIIDGAAEYEALFYVIIPSISATVAAVGMFLALGMWNMWFPVMIYTNKEKMWTLQYFLRAVVFEKLLEYQPAAEKARTELGIARSEGISPLNFQMAAIILVALPIIFIYPFIQKYFVKGILAGSVKG